MEYYRTRIGKRLLWLEVISRSDHYLFAWEVTQEGEHTSRKHLIQHGSVRLQPATMDLHYGLLDVVKTKPQRNRKGLS